RVQLTQPTGVTDTKVCRRQRVRRNLRERTQHVVLVECIQQVQIKLQRVTSVASELDRVRHLEISLREHRRASEVAARVQEGESAIQLHASRIRRSTKTNERRAKLGAVGT